MRTRLSFLAICSLLVSLLTTTTPANSLTANLEVIAVTDSKPGEVELTFVSKVSNKRSYQITAKPKSGVGLTFSKTYKKRAPGYITHKISPLTSEVDYIFTITATTTKNKLIKSAPYNYLVSSTVPSTPLITKVEATDADEAVVFFTAPKDDGGTPIYYYTATSNPGAISVIAPIQGSGSVTVTGLTKATTYTFTLTAHNINGSSRAATSPAPITTLAEKIVRSSPASTTNAPTLASPAFTLSSSSQSVIVNYAITTVTNTSTGGAISSYAISPAAPAGLTFSTTTGQLSGTPTSTQSATNYTITATNAAGSATQTFTLTVTVGTPAFSLSSTAETQVATTAITGYTINSTGAPITSYSYVGTLPSGLAFSTSTGRITGTPTETRTATTYTIIGASASGETATATYRLRVTGDIGDTGPGGGRIFYYLAAGFSCGASFTDTGSPTGGKCKYLEVAPNNWITPSDSTTVLLGNRNDAAQVSGVRLDASVVYNANDVGLGYKNSIAFRADSRAIANTGIRYVRDYNGGSLGDWYLPNSTELNILVYWSKGLSPVVNVRTTSNAAIINGDFTTAYYYYSSSQTGANPFGAHIQSFNNGATVTNQWSDAGMRVRPIRAF